MFKSKRRPVAIPQSEHARLAGILASLWGNDDFDKPTFDFPSFVLGVTLHDRGYGLHDAKPINEVSEAVWLQTQRDGILASVSNPITNIVSLLHIRRLLGYSEAPDTEPLTELANRHIKMSLSKTNHTYAEFEWADQITCICDSTTFAFSFEKPEHVRRPVCPRVGSDETILVDFSVDGLGLIRADPWPLSVEHYEGFVIGYELDGYPDRLEPVYIPFALVK